PRWRDWVAIQAKSGDHQYSGGNERTIRLHHASQKFFKVDRIGGESAAAQRRRCTLWGPRERQGGGPSGCGARECVRRHKCCNPSRQFAHNFVPPTGFICNTVKKRLG